MTLNMLVFAADLQFGVVNRQVEKPGEIVLVRWLEHCFHHAYNTVRDATGRAAARQKLD